MTLAPGLYDDITDIDYHADRGSLSQSGAKLLLPPSTPAEFRWTMDHSPEPKKQFDFGHAAHALVLGVGSELREIPADMLASNGAASTKEAKAFMADARAAGAVPLKADEIQVVTDMAAGIQDNPLAAALFTEGQAEQSGYWIDPDTGVKLRFRTDWLTWRGGQCYCVDYKTSTTANPDKFRASVADYGYHQQDDWYRNGLRATDVSDDAIFLFVVQSKNPPYLVSVVQLTADAVAVGAQLNRQAIDLYAWCIENDRWPGYDPEIHQIDLPPWAKKDYL